MSIEKPTQEEKYRRAGSFISCNAKIIGETEEE
jgi:hypothetical protein